MNRLENCDNLISMVHFRRAMEKNAAQPIGIVFSKISLKSNA